MRKKDIPTEQKNLTFKITTLIAIFLFLISTVTAVVVWKGVVESRINILEIGQSSQEDRLKSLESDNLEIKVKLASIDARLSNIESTLIEIKNKI